jgi:prophage maintenance system killer protein
MIYPAALLMKHISADTNLLSSVLIIHDLLQLNDVSLESVQR